MNNKSNMKRYFIYSVLAIAAAFATGCAKSNETTSNDDELQYIEAWLQVNNSSAVKAGHGIYILEDKTGNGTIYAGESYVYVTRTIRSLDGTIISSDSEEIAKRLGTYREAYYYGPKMIPILQETSLVGIADMFDGMRIGGERTALIPTWLMTSDQYEDTDEYFEHVLDEENKAPLIYTIKLHEVTSDVETWETRILTNYLHVNYPELYLDNGFTYKVLKEKTADIANDESFYINYTGRLLNGKVFDTTIEDTAKVHNIWSSKKTYGPVQVKKAENETGVTLSSSSVIPGFGKAINLIDKDSKIVCFFLSSLGYEGSGSGSSIPPYAPLSFEIEEVVKN